jgi:hypothetical protein
MVLRNSLIQAGGDGTPEAKTLLKTQDVDPFFDDEGVAGEDEHMQGLVSPLALGKLGLGRSGEKPGPQAGARGGGTASRGADIGGVHLLGDSDRSSSYDSSEFDS